MTIVAMGFLVAAESIFMLRSILLPRWNGRFFSLLRLQRDCGSLPPDPL